MDHRDKIALYGSDLQSLPDVRVDEEQMTATFYADPEPPAPTPPAPPSKLEEWGRRLDIALVSGVTKIVDKLGARGLLPDRGHVDFPSYKGKTGWSELPKNAGEFIAHLKSEGFYDIARISVDVHKKWRQGHNVQVSLRCGKLCPKPIARFLKSEVWVAFNGRPVQGSCHKPGPDSWWGVVPLQVGIGPSPCPRY